MLDGDGSGMIGLMEFCGSMTLMGIEAEELFSMDDASVFLGLDQDCDGFISVEHFVNLRDLVKPKLSRPPTRATDDDQPQSTVSLIELRLLNPKKDPPDVAKAKLKWANIARWMAAASQRSIALRTERLLKGWRVDAKLKTQSPSNQDASDETLQKEPEPSEAIAEGDVGTPPSRSPSSRSAPSRSPKKSLHSQVSTNSFPTLLEPGERRRTPTATPKELALESLAIMKEQEGSLKVSFNACASIKLPDGTPEMSRKDLHVFFQDLHLADMERHVNVSPKLLDKLYDEALDLQCRFTRIGNGLTFWSVKVVLSGIIGPLGLGWRHLIEKGLHPDVLAEATRCGEES
jgi:hypothetical protein